MHIDGKETTVHDVERLILSLYWNKNISERDNDRLSNDYKRERQRWLDSQFQHNEENTKRLNEVSKMLAAADKRLRDTAETFVTEQSARGEQGAKCMTIHIEIEDQLGGPSEGITDEDAELWDALCNEDRYHDPHWGFRCFKVDLTEKKVKLIDLLWWKRAHQGNEPSETIEQRFSTIRERYFLAWQDIIRIPRFVMTVEMETE